MSEEMKWMNGFICRGSHNGRVGLLLLLSFFCGLMGLAQPNAPQKRDKQSKAANQFVFFLFHFHLMSE
jgi:hypothetical protein